MSDAAWTWTWSVSVRRQVPQHADLQTQPALDKEDKRCQATHSMTMTAIGCGAQQTTPARQCWQWRQFRIESQQSWLILKRLTMKPTARGLTHTPAWYQVNLYTFIYICCLCLCTYCAQCVGRFSLFTRAAHSAPGWRLISHLTSLVIKNEKFLIAFCSLAHCCLCSVYVTFENWALSKKCVVI